jgi:hypothetical protein
MPKKLTTEIFIERSRTLHSDKYDYSKVEYTSQRSLVNIICPIHGEFLVASGNHLKGVGCASCSLDIRISEFIDASNEIHNYKYDYTKIDYKNGYDYVTITCPTHGDFNQQARKHREGREGCKKCSSSSHIQRRQSDLSDMISSYQGVHGEKYDYTKTTHHNYHTKTTVICREHGEFKIFPKSHLNGSGCVECEYNKRYNNFIDTCNNIHNHKYDYSKVLFTTISTDKIIITCPEHGDFTQQSSHHVNGFGCAKCSGSKGERLITSTLDQNNILYNSEHRFDDCTNILTLPFDFYIPSKNMIIEYHGEQHYKYVKFFHSTIEGFNKHKQRDQIKAQYCKDNNIELLVIPFSDYKNIPEIILGIL